MSRSKTEHVFEQFQTTNQNSILVNDGQCEDHGRIEEQSDFEQSVRSASSTKFESIWLSSPEQSPSRQNMSMLTTNDENQGNFDFEERSRRFLFPPPKLSGPYDHSLESTVGTSMFGNNRKGFSGEFSNLSLEPGNGSLIGSTKGENYVETSLNKRRLQQQNHNSVSSDPEHIFETRTNGESSGGNQGRHLLERDTIQKHKPRRRSRQRREQHLAEERHFTDEGFSGYNESTDRENESVGLQQRSHQAWKARQKKSVSKRTRQERRNKLPNDGSNVSLANSGRMHSIESDRGRRRENYLGEEMSIDRSLNSDYTKTLESEVEDIFKDILFIGNPSKSKPGKRKYRHKPEIKRKLKEENAVGVQVKSNITSLRVTSDESQARLEVEDGQGSSSPETIENAPFKCRTPSKNTISISKSKKQSQKSVFGDDRFSMASTLSQASSNDNHTVESVQTEKDLIVDSVDTMIGLVEGSLSVVSSAIGYAIENFTSAGENENSMNECKEKINEYDFLEYCGFEIGEQKIKAQPRDNETNGAIKIERDARKETSYPVDPYTSRLDRDLDEALIIDKSSLLSNLALHATRSVHKLQGVAYDESIEIDLMKEIKLCSVTLKLPLGIVFLENDGGCFVTKVSPDGSAAISGGVEIGDQLVSINGVNSENMKVDDICNAVKFADDQGGINIVFLRYIGPIRPRSKTKYMEHFSTSSTPKQSIPTHSSEEVVGRKSPQLRNKISTKRKGTFRLFGRARGNKKNGAAN